MAVNRAKPAKIPIKPNGQAKIPVLPRAVRKASTHMIKPRNPPRKTQLLAKGLSPIFIVTDFSPF